MGVIAPTRRRTVGPDGAAMFAACCYALARDNGRDSVYHLRLSEFAPATHSAVRNQRTARTFAFVSGRVEKSPASGSNCDSTRDPTDRDGSQLDGKAPTAHRAVAKQNAGMKVAGTNRYRIGDTADYCC